MEEILPVAARAALLDYKPGDVVIAPTGRGWHIVKVREECGRCCFRGVVRAGVCSGSHCWYSSRGSCCLL